MATLLKRIKNLVWNHVPSVRYVSTFWHDFRDRRFKPYIKRKHVEGVEFDFLVADLWGQRWHDLECTDPHHLQLNFHKNHHTVQPGDVVFDCGANQGCMTIVFSEWVGPHGKVVSFEPVPKNGYIIRKNLELNNIQNVQFEQKALGSRDGVVAMANHSNSFVTDTGKGCLNVEMTYLDKYAHLCPTFLKIDVEGLEVEVLRGAQEILKTRPKLDIEIHPEVLFERYNACVEDVFSLLDKNAYEFWVKWDESEMPRRYYFETPIEKRVNLLAFPR